MTKMAHWHSSCLFIQKTHPWATSTFKPSHHHKRVSSLSFQVMKAEGFVTGTVQLYQDMDGEVLIADNDHLPFKPRLTRHILRMNP